MLRQGRSFSGKERNCLFLNTGNSSEDTPRFADISASSGIDFPDDGRAIALVDWDQDGDLDMWLANRNAPRIRLMRNDTPSDSHYVSLRLQGNGKNTNRDAIGARVELIMPEGEERRFIQTLYSSQGLVSQSSKWMHFGLGDNDRIEAVVVTWPTAGPHEDRKERFTGVGIDGRFRLVQGTGTAEPVAPREQPVELEAKTQTLRKPEGAIRVPAVTLYKFPKRVFPATSRRPRIATGEGRSVLFNLWGSWCRPCRKELMEITARQNELRRAGIDVVALSVDSVDEEFGDVDAAKAFMHKIRFPFVAGSATAGDVARFQKYDDLLTHINRPLPIPSSFLIDPDGNVAVLYKGSVTVDQLLKDVSHSRGDLKQRWKNLTDLDGRLMEDKLVVQMLRDHEAIVKYHEGTAHMQDGRVEMAVDHLRKAVEYDRNFAKAHQHLGNAYRSQGKADLALQALQRAVAIQPNMPQAHFELSIVHQQANNVPAAVAALRRAIKYDADGTFNGSDLNKLAQGMPQSPELGKWLAGSVIIQNRLAWLMATSPDPEVRNGDEAIRWAQRIVEQTRRSRPGPLWTLAAAYAENERYDEAITVAKEARHIAEILDFKPGVKENMLKRIADQIEHYERGEPYRDIPAKPAANPPAAEPAKDAS